MDVELVQDLRRNVVVVAEKRKQQMLRADHIGLVELGLEVGDLEDLFRLLRQRNIADGEGSSGCADSVLDRFLQLVEVDAEISEDLHGNAFALADDPEEQMLRADIVVPQPECFFAAEADDILNSV